MQLHRKPISKGWNYDQEVPVSSRWFPASLGVATQRSMAWKDWVVQVDVFREIGSNEYLASKQWGLYRKVPTYCKRRCQKEVRKFCIHALNKCNLNEAIWMKSDIFRFLSLANLNGLEMNKRVENKRASLFCVVLHVLQPLHTQIPSLLLIFWMRSRGCSVICLPLHLGLGNQACSLEPETPLLFRICWNTAVTFEP